MSIDLNKPLQYRIRENSWLDCEVICKDFKDYKGNYYICKMFDPVTQNHCLRWLNTSDNPFTASFWRNKPKNKIKYGVILYKLPNSIRLLTQSFNDQYECTSLEHFKKFKISLRWHIIEIKEFEYEEH